LINVFVELHQTDGLLSCWFFVRIHTPKRPGRNDYDFEIDVCRGSSDMVAGRKWRCMWYYRRKLHVRNEVGQIYIIPIMVTELLCQTIFTLNILWKNYASFERNIGSAERLWEKSYLQFDFYSFIH